MEETPKLTFNFPSVRLLLLPFVLLAAVAFVSGAAFAADTMARADRADLRIQDMHTKLKITAAQEEQWGKVAEVMRDNAKVMDALTQARMDHAQGMTAIDDLKSYGEIATAHADGIRKLTPVFADLYAGMSDPQKLEADTLFRHGPGKRGYKRSAPRAPAGQ
jgi:periplasmic protein CpxP/Spy